MKYFNLLIWFFSSVYPQMQFQFKYTWKSFITITAFIWCLISVFHQMWFKTTISQNIIIIFAMWKSFNLPPTRHLCLLQSLMPHLMIHNSCLKLPFYKIKYHNRNIKSIVFAMCKSLTPPPTHHFHLIQSLMIHLMIHNLWLLCY